MYSVAVQQTRSVNSVVAEALGYTEERGYLDGPRRVTDLVSDARNVLGFLTKTSQGKTGGTLTAAGRALLTDDEYLDAVSRVDKVIAKREQQKQSTKRKAKK